MILADPQGSDAATLYAGSAAAALGIGNLRTRQPREVWRATDLGAIWFEMDFGAAFAWDTLALIAHNGTSAATWRIKAGASQANVEGGAPSFDQGPFSLWPSTGRPSGYTGLKLSSLYRPGTTQTFQWLRVEITDAANPDGYFEAGRALVDVAWQPSRNLQFGSTLGFIDPSPRDIGLGGQLYPHAVGKRRVMEFNLGHLGEDEMYDNAHELTRRQGTTGEVVVVRDPAATTHLHRQMIYGLMTGLKPINNKRLRLYETRYKIEELV